MISILTWFLSILAMVLGFGFVIFWHELGHFLGARWAGIRVEQFAVGMGHAIVSYRKGLGFRRGNTMEEFERLTSVEFERRRRDSLGFTQVVGEPTIRQRYDIAKEIGLGETEYRISWLPIGGYVKPTGQDDLRPADQAAGDDPHSYAAASVGHRMIMISAGVIMNVILAAILFFVLFRFVGFDAMRPIVGQLQSGSPAAMAGLRAGDELLELNGHTLHDFTKILMNVALLPSDEPVLLKYMRDGVEKDVQIQARRTQDNSNMLALGFGPAYLLRTLPESALAKPLTDEERALTPLLPGERIVAIDGKPVVETDYAILDAAVQGSHGKPITLQVKDKNDATRDVVIKPMFAVTFNRERLAFLHATPRAAVARVQDDSSAKGKLLDGDIILSIKPSSVQEAFQLPTVEAFIATTRSAGSAGESLDFSVLRDGKVVAINGIEPKTKLQGGGVGLGVQISQDAEHAVIAMTDDGSPLKRGMTITAIDGQPIASWYDVQRVLASRETAGELSIETTSDAGNETIKLPLSEPDLAFAKSVRYAHTLPLLEDWTKVRETDSALTALGWGVGETRDLILNGYLTLRRVVTGSVPASNMSGPIGIFHAGTKLAQRGTDWFIWFLAVISANLAVVNFLPVPILDGWHFLSLVKEKITGRALSERVQEVAQYVGLALILSLIVFVTYNDIARLIFG